MPSNCILIFLFLDQSFFHTHKSYNKKANASPPGFPYFWASRVLRCNESMARTICSSDIFCSARVSASKNDVVLSLTRSLAPPVDDGDASGAKVLCIGEGKETRPFICTNILCVKKGLGDCINKKNIVLASGKKTTTYELLCSWNQYLNNHFPKPNVQVAGCKMMRICCFEFRISLPLI